MKFRCIRFCAPAAVCALAILLPSALRSQQSSNSAAPAAVPEAMYSNLHWRLIGPFRAGKSECVTGVPGNTSTYYMGTPGGGVWKTVDSGRVWFPVFDAAKVASIGAIAVPWTNADIVYVGTGYQGPGNGIWKSTDAGATWKNIGLGETRMISAILIDPKSPDTVFAAAPGDALSGENRGVYKSTDGGASWRKVLYLDPQSGVISISLAPDAPNVIFASFQSRVFGRQAVEHGIYKSTDGGDTWQEANGAGLPQSGMGKIGVLVAPNTRGKRVYAIMNQGFFRSDDQGATWTRANYDARIVSTGQFGGIYSNPQNPDDIFISQTSMYRSQDGGANWEPFTGAPSGDDYNYIWVNPDDPRFMAQSVDQGSVISEDGGKTWSSWYNQPTGQLYHVITDNQFPYNIYAAQQDSGTVAFPSRSDYGQIGDNERFSIAGFEAAYIAPDPLNPNFIYSNAWYGSVIRYDRSTGQLATVFVRTDKYRTASMAPLLYAPQDSKTLYLGTQYLMKTTNGGTSWQEISPDLTEVPKTAETQQDAAQAARRGGPGGALNTVSFSTVKAGTIWTGSSNGRIHMTTDGGKHWNDVTPSDLATPASIGIIDSSHFDTSSAYATVTTGGRGGAGNPGPTILRTHDAGKSWQKIVNGLPAGAPGLDAALFVREDTVRKGLLFAGTQSAMWVSFDDGDHWQSLQLNLPVAQMRDLVVKGNDLVLATYGRSIWSLDDITPLRNAQAELAGAANPLYSPPDALRWRWDNYQDTPPTIEMTAASGKNPPDGAIIDYYLPNAAKSATIEIADAKGQLIRKYTSEAPALPKLKPNVPDYWFAPPTVVGTGAGPHRFVWDLRYSDPVILPYNYYGALINYTEYTLADHAIPGELQRGQPSGALVAPGVYTITLTVDGQSFKQQLRVNADPRIHASQADLDAQIALAQRIMRGLQATTDTFWQVKELADAIADRQKSLASAGNAAELSGNLKSLADQVHAIGEGTQTAPGVGPANRDLARIFQMIESGDIRPTDSAMAAVSETCGHVDEAFLAWRNLNAGVSPTSIPPGADAKPPVLLSSINSQLAAANLAPLPVVANVPTISPCAK